MADAHRGRAGLRALVAAFLLVAAIPAVRAADAPAPAGAPAPERADVAWRDPNALRPSFEMALTAVEAACEARFVKRPTVLVSTAETMQALYEKARLAQFAREGLGRPTAWFVGRPDWLVHLDSETNVVHVMPEMAEDAAADPARAVLATEAGLRLLLVDALVKALDGERYPDAGPDAVYTSDDPAYARKVVRWARQHAAMASAAADWGLSKELDQVRRAMFRGNPDFACTAGVAFLAAVRAERGAAGVEAVLRDPPASTREIERPELWLHPEWHREDVDLDALLIPVRDMLQDPLWHVDVMRPSDDQFKRSMRRLGNSRMWEPPVRSVDARYLQASDQAGGSRFGGAEVLVWAVLYADEASARSVVDAWAVAQSAEPNPRASRTKGTGPHSRFHGIVIERDINDELHATHEVSAIGRIALVLSSIGAPELDRTRLDVALERMAAFVADPSRARAAWAKTPGPLIPHSRLVAVEVQGPAGEVVPLATVCVRTQRRPWEWLTLRAGTAHLRLPVGIGAILSLRAARSEDGTALPFAPVEEMEVTPEQTFVRVAMGPGKVLEGDVQDYDEKPIPGVVVVAVPERWGRDDPLAALGAFQYGRATSGPDGRFRIVGVGDQPYRLAAYEGAAEGPVAELDSASAEDEAHVQVPRGVGPILSLVDTAGRPVVGARVTIRKPFFPWNNRHAILVDGLTDAEGRIRAFVPSHARFRLVVIPPQGSHLDDPEIDGDWWAPASQRLVLPEGEAATGVVVDADGAPVKGTVFRPSAEGFVSVETEDDGTFRFRGLGVSSVRLLAVPGYRVKAPPAGVPSEAWTEVAREKRKGLTLRAWTPPQGPTPAGAPK